MKKVARLRIAQDEQFVPPGVKINANPEQTVRTTGRIKKPKAVFDPSDNYMPRSQRLSTQFSLQAITPPGKLGASASTSPSTTGTRRERSLSTGSNTSNTSIPLTNDICIVCQKREPRRGGNYRNKLISCVDCSKRVHKLCMSVDFYESAPVRLNFKCDSCRTCEVCSSNASLEAITCSKCCKTYHLGCHVPKIPKIYQTERHWKCSKCHPINASSTGINNKSEPVMPVKIIRQIIGDNVNLTNAVPKSQQPVGAKEQSKQSQEPTKSQQQQSSQQHQKIKPQPLEQSEELVEIPGTDVEASIKASALRRRSTDSVTTSTSDNSDDDEDYEYIEKKKRRYETKHNNNHDHINASDTNSDKQLDKKSTIIASKNSINSINDLPKREDVKAWSVEKVAAYIGEYFPNEAFVFKDQEIDGNALLLLKRSDVVQKLPLKLGPSLRLYNLILKVQTQTVNDPTLGWDCSIDTLLPSTE